MRDFSDVWIIAGLVVVAILFLMGMVARMYRKAGPHEALIVYGFRGTRIIKGGGTIIFPMVEQCKELSLELMSFDVAPPSATPSACSAREVALTSSVSRELMRMWI